MSGSPGISRELGRVAKGSSLNFAGAIARSLLGFLFVFTLARLLGAADMGLFFLGVNVIMFVVILAIGGMDVGLRRFISIAHGNEDAIAAWSYFLSAAVIACGLCALFSIGLFLGADTLASRLFSKPELASVIHGLIPFLFVYAFAELMLSATQGYKQMQYWVFTLDLANNALRILFAVVTVIAGMGLQGVVTGYVFAIAFAALLAYRFFRQVMPPLPNHRVGLRLREIASFSLPSALARLLNSSGGLLETLLLGYFVTTQDLGVYTVALKVAVMGGIVLASFNTMFSPLISQLHSQQRLDELGGLFKVVTRWTFSISLPLFALVAWYATPILYLFGDDYLVGVGCILLLCMGQLINTLTGPSGNLLLMSGHSFTNLWTNLVGVALSLALNLLLIPAYGILGCALAVAVAISVTNLIRLALAWHYLRIHPYETIYWKPVVAVLVSVAILALAGPDNQSALGVLELGLAGTAGLILYAGTLAMLGFADADRWLFSKLQEKIRS